MRSEVDMEPETEEKIEKMQDKLTELGVDMVQPPNPYCATVVLMGTAQEPEVILNFWRGEPESVEFLREEFPLKMLSRLTEALRKAGRIVEEFPV